MHQDDKRPLDRRQLLTYAAFGSAVWAGGSGQAQDDSPAGEGREPSKRYSMKKSINQWAFPYPEKMSLEQCLRLAKDAGFDGIELNYDLDNDLSDPPGDRGRHPLPPVSTFRRTLRRLGLSGRPVVCYDDSSGATAARMWWMLRALNLPAAVLDVSDGPPAIVSFQPQGQLVLTLNSGALGVWSPDLEQPLGWTASLAGIRLLRTVWAPRAAT